MAQIPFLLSRRILIVFPCLVLAGCGGTGQEEQASTESQIPVPQPSTSSDWVNGSVADSFDVLRAAQIRNSARFQGVDANHKDGGADQSHPYELSRLDLVLSGGWTGAGQRVAVVDDGFRTTHQEFAGTDIVTNGNIAVDVDSSHGTHVAALITGSDDTGVMMGVAPDADLHLTSYLRDDRNGSIDITKLAAATLEASDLGAVAQNNSWGLLYKPDPDTTRELLLSDVRDHMNATGSTVPEAFASLSGGDEVRWDNYFDALDTFQSDGVIVWAMSNNETLAINDASSALPRLIPELKDAWIAVGNGLFQTDANNEIISAQRLSAPCREMATQCLFADGTTRSAGVSSDTAYGLGTGSSFAAPQVSGAIAIMAQAFPSLSPQEWTKRLLATAYSDFDDFDQDGTFDFGAGVSKAYSEEWGMGVLDIAAALSPVNGVSLVNGRTLASSERGSFESGALISGAAYGDGTRAALADVEIAVFDSLDTPFLVPADALAVTAQTDLQSARPLPLISSASQIEYLSASGLDRQNLRAGHSSLSITSAAVGGADLVSTARGLANSAAAVGSLATLAGQGAALVAEIDAGPVTMMHYGLLAQHATENQNRLGAIGAGIDVDLGPLSVTGSIQSAHETGGALGLSGGGAMGGPDGASMQSLALAGQVQLGAGGAVFAGVETGSAQADQTDGYIGQLEGLAFSAFQFGFTAPAVLDPTDRLTLTISQPLRIESGQIDFTLPAGRTRSGAVISRTHSATLEPTGRQIDIGLNYQLAPTKQSTLEFGAQISHDAAHHGGSLQTVFGGQFQARF